MEQSLSPITLRWNLLRIITLSELAACSLLILVTITRTWWSLAVPVLSLGLIFAALTLIRPRPTLMRVTLLAQGSLFALALGQSILGITLAVNVPILLFVFTIFLAAEHSLTLIMTYAQQFSKPKDGSISIFNLPVLHTSLDRLYRKIAWDGVIFGMGFLLSVAIAIFATNGPVVGFLADPSLYAIIVSLSVAMLIVLKDQ